jgi:hypothetical protein
MRVYVGQTRAKALIEELARKGIGECTARGELPPRRTPWFYDNGAFGDWKAGRPFDRQGFERDLAETNLRPDFIVVPDIVAGGAASLTESLSWLALLKGLAPRYLAIQDGMTHGDVARALDSFEGAFVGGTLPWKMATGREWCDLAHELGKPCHIGRVGNLRRLAWAYECGADSVDSSFPLWSRQRLGSFLRRVTFRGDARPEAGPALLMASR